MSERQDDDLIALDLIRHSKRKAIQHRDSAVRPTSPLWRSFGKLEDRLQYGIDLVFELGSEPDAARFVIVDLVVRSRRPPADGCEASTTRAGDSALANVSAILVERHRLSGPGVDFGTATLDLGVPCFRRAGIGCAVEATDELHG
jgi:hypothetical protein